jgi:chromosomal replication initiation ATPase DnaA
VIPAPDQIPLQFPYRPGFATADFMPAASNEAALAWIARPEDWPERRLLVWGEAGTGKTHLLHIWCRGHRAGLLTATSLPVLERPPETGLSIDDADQVSDETRLLHLLNAAGEAGHRVLLAARTPPARWTIRLPDLASRLRAITAVPIAPPEDSLLRALLARLLADRQLAVAAGLQEWLLRRLPRTAAAYREAVARLAEDGGPIDRMLAARVLAELDVPEASA